MKHVSKIISKILIAALLLTCGVSAFAVDFDLGGSLNTGGLNDLNVMQAVCDYMDTRAAYLLGEIDSMDWLVNGINNDEAAHKAKLAEEGADLNASDYEIISVECGDTEAVVVVHESVDYTMNTTEDSEIVVHKLRLMLYDETTPFVGSDGYMERFSGFESCSYIDTSLEYATNSLQDNGDSMLCILQIAISQLGEGENEDGETEYAAMFGNPKGKWCAAFICWCAMNANVATTDNDNTAVIYWSNDCDDHREFHVRQNTYYESQAFGGTGAPQPGDIMFIGHMKADGTLDATHVALIEEVVGNTIKYINPNSSDGTVKRCDRRVTDPDILGYGRPKYEGHTSVTYSYANGSHSGTCVNCGAAFEEECHMVGTSNNSTTHTVACTDCGNSYTALHYLSHSYNADNSAHWKKCINCDYKQSSDHSCNGAYDTDEISHSRICSICEHVVTQNHTYGSYTKTANTHSRTCNECQYSYTEAHNYVLNLILKVQICSDCGYSMAGPGVLDSMIPDEEYVTE